MKRKIQCSWKYEREKTSLKYWCLIQLYADVALDSVMGRMLVYAEGIE
jgi:hypothetical protein